MFSQVNFYIGIVLIGIPMVTSQPDQIMIAGIDSCMLQNLTRGQLSRRCPLWLAVQCVGGLAPLTLLAFLINSGAPPSGSEVFGTGFRAATLLVVLFLGR